MAAKTLTALVFALASVTLYMLMQQMTAPPRRRAGTAEKQWMDASGQLRAAAEMMLGGQAEAAQTEAAAVKDKVEAKAALKAELEPAKASVSSTADAEVTTPRAKAETVAEDGHVSVHAPSNESVIGLLFPPGLNGGYRNQVIRLIAFVMHAQSQNIRYILLESLIAVTQLPETYVPFESLHDVDYWNSFHAQLPGDEGFTFPLLVDYHASSNYTCWKRGVLDQEVTEGTRTTARSDMSAKADLIMSKRHQPNHTLVGRGFFVSIYNQSRALMMGDEAFDQRKLRRLDLLSEARQCKGNPIPYGGATRLWLDYHKGVREETRTGVFPFNTRTFVLQALRPKKKWRELSLSCTSSNDFVGLHLRMEYEMMEHKCGKQMEHNATRLFGHISEFLASRSGTIRAIAVATSRQKMSDTNHTNRRLQAVANENLRTLNHFTRSNRTHLFGGYHVSVVECGEDIVAQYFEKNPLEDATAYGSALPSMVNFDMLTRAKIFIGVRKSSYSTDVWTTRYHQGRGRDNYEYTPKGITPIENGGLPTPHTSC